MSALICRKAIETEACANMVFSFFKVSRDTNEAEDERREASVSTS
jgi:hypothetical protein